MAIACRAVGTLDCVYKNPRRLFAKQFKTRTANDFLGTCFLAVSMIDGAVINIIVGSYFVPATSVAQQHFSNFEIARIRLLFPVVVHSRRENPQSLASIRKLAAAVHKDLNSRRTMDKSNS